MRRRTVPVMGMLLLALSACSISAEDVGGPGTPNSEVVEPSPEPSADAVSERSTPTTQALPERRDLIVAEHGFQAYEMHDGGTSLSWAVLFENPNSAHWIARRIDLTLTFLDAEGTVLSSESDSIAAILPGQKTALGNTAFDIGGEVTDMRVQARARDWEEAEDAGPYGEFQTAGVNVREASFGGWDVTGTVESSFSQDFEDVYAAAVLRDSADDIVGGGFTFVDFVPAGDSTSVEVNIADDLSDVASAELYLTLSNLSLLGGED